MLTRKQHELLMFIHRRIRENGVSPSFDEMKEALDLRSKSGIHRLITALEERGFIRRLPHRARALEILRLPETAVPADTAAAALPGGQGGASGGAQGGGGERPRGFSPNVIEGSLSKGAGAASGSDPGTRSAAEDVEAEALSVPVLGRIAAGTPIEALQQTSHHVPVPSQLLGGQGEHYALEVKGDSMIEAGILDGDTVIIRRCDSATNGDIVVALVDDQEATLKRLRKKGDTVALEAANPAYETRIFGPDRVKVQGRLVGLLRQY